MRKCRAEQDWFWPNPVRLDYCTSPVGRQARRDRLAGGKRGGGDGGMPSDAKAMSAQRQAASRQSRRPPDR